MARGAGQETAGQGGAQAPGIPDIDRCIQTGIHEGTFSAAACVASVGGRVFHRAVYGQPARRPPARRAPADLVFDLGSLTRPLATGLAALWLTGRGRIDPSASVARSIPELGDGRFAGITLDMLLDHTSGLPAMRPLWQDLEAADDARPAAERVAGTRRAVPELRRLLSRVSLESEPGTCAVESDLGFLALGWILEGVVGQPLDLWLEREIYRPLGIADDLFFVRLDDPARRQRLARRTFAAGEKVPWRDDVVQGEPSDPTAWAAGGVAGHAGLFGTGDAVWTLAHALWESHTGAGRFFLGGAVKRFWTRSRRVADTTRALAWDTTRVNDSPAGKRFSQASVGHVGSLGSAVWIDLATDVIGVFLCNANHPSLEGKAAAVAKLQPRLFELIAKHGEALAPEGRPQGSRAFYAGPIQGGAPPRNPVRGPGR